jgi:hypothetical protein
MEEWKYACSLSETTNNVGTCLSVVAEGGLGNFSAWQDGTGLPVLGLLDGGTPVD